MIISYFLTREDKPSLLGTEQYSDIEQILFPDVNHFQHPITITKFFKSEKNHRWKVERVEHPTSLSLHIFLSERKDAESLEFLDQTIKSDKTVLSKLTKGTLIEVEFGYIPSVKKSCGTARSSKRYPDQIQIGEMHKRRLAIVVRAEPGSVQVIPITSKPRSIEDKSAFVLSEESLSNLVEYHNPLIESFAICNMIQTVSPRRIFSPLSRSRKAKQPLRHKHYPNRLSRSDTKLLNSALSRSVGILDYHELITKSGQLSSQNRELQSSIQKIEARYESLRNEFSRVKEAEKHYNALLEVMIEWKMRIQPINKEAAKAEIENEMLETAEILELLGRSD